MNAIIQPIHLLLYTFLVSTSVSLVVKNPLYAIKKMFGINAETTSGMGSFAGGAVAMAGLQKLAGMGKNFKSKDSSSSGDKEISDDGKGDNIKFAKQPNDDVFGSFNGAPLPTGGEGNQDGIQQDDNEQRQENIEPQDERHRRMLEARAAAERLANEETATPGRRRAAEQAMKNIDEKMEKAGYLPQGKKDVRLEENNPKNNIESTNPTNLNDRPQKDKHWKRKLAGKAMSAGGKKAFRAAKGTAKVAAKVAGGLAGATIGLAAGVATGDPSKAFTYAAGGALAGNTIAKNAVNTAGAIGTGIQELPGKFEKIDDNIQYSIDEAKYGAKYAREQKIAKQNEQATKKFLNDERSIEKWKDVQAELGDKSKTEDFMKVVADYKKADPKMSDDMIKNALKLEQEYGNKQIGGTAHKQVVDVARFTTKNDYGREYVEKEDKRKVLDAHIDSKISNDNARKQIKEIHAKLNGVGHLRK